MEATLRGNLGIDPEATTLPSGMIAGRMRIAVTQSRAEREKNAPTVWVDVRTYGELAERCRDLLHSGDPVLLNGYWRAEEWDGQDGKKQRRTYVYATALGPDLTRCTIAGLTRPAKKTGQPDEPATGAESPDPFDED